MLEPTTYVAKSIEPPMRNWLHRAAIALFVERRLPYRVAQKWDRLCRRAGWTRKTVSVDGCRFHVRRLTCDEDFIQNILVDREYTPPGYEVRDDDIVIDIGGNIGVFAVHAARQTPRGRVYAFEPSGENYELLRQNISLNKFENISAFHAAVVGTPGPVKLYLNHQGGFHSIQSDRRSDSSKYELVEGVKLQEIFDRHEIAHCDLLKIDCEGAEYEILYNLPRQYFDRIDRITMEYHGSADAQERRTQSNQLVAYLQQAGYEIDAYEEFVGFRGGHIRARRRQPG